MFFFRAVAFVSFASLLPSLSRSLIQIGILFGDIQYFIRLYQFGGWHFDAHLLAHITPKRVCVSCVRERKTICLGVHLFKFAAIQVLDTDIVWEKISFRTQLFPMALVRIIGLEFGIYHIHMYIIMNGIDIHFRYRVSNARTGEWYHPNSLVDLEELRD